MIEVIAKYADIDEPQAFFAREKVEYVVRCRDCEHFDPIIHSCRRFDDLCGEHVSYVFDDGFCAWGVRKYA